MAKQNINNSETGLVVRNKLNSMFTELYNYALTIRDATTANAYNLTEKGHYSTGPATTNIPTTNKTGILELIPRGTSKYLFYKTYNAGVVEYWANFYNGSSWGAWSKTQTKTFFTIGTAASDIESDLGTGPDKSIGFVPYDMIVTDVWAGIGRRCVGSNVIADILIDDVSMLSARISIDASIPNLGMVELTGGSSGSINSITVNAIEIMTATVAYNTSLWQTADDVIANINAHTSTPNYTAEHGTDYEILIREEVETTNTYTVAVTTTVIETFVQNMSGGVTELTSLTANIQPVISNNSLTKGQKINYQLDQVGADETGKALLIYIGGYIV